MDLQELYKTKEWRMIIFIEILKKDNLSIVEIVNAKETAMNSKISEKNELISGLAFRATAMFWENPKEVIKAIEQVKPLVAKDIFKSWVVKWTRFEQKLLKTYPIL